MGKKTGHMKPQSRRCCISSTPRVEVGGMIWALKSPQDRLVCVGTKSKERVRNEERKREGARAQTLRDERGWGPSEESGPSDEDEDGLLGIEDLCV